MRYLYWGLTLLIALACAVFAAHNRGPITADLWPFPSFELPLYLAVLVPLAFGFLFGWSVSWFGHFGTRRERRRLARHTEKLEAQIERTKEPASPGRSLTV